MIIIISSYPQLFIVEIHEGKHRKKRTVDEYFINSTWPSPSL